MGGVGALALVLTIDSFKGMAAVWLSTRLSPSPWAVPVSGAAAVVGRAWPVWLGFRGGMGLATGMGAVASQDPLAVLIAATLAGLFKLILRHTPRATIAASLCLPPVLWLLPVTPLVFWLGTLIALLVAFRHLGDWNRIYE